MLDGRSVIQLSSNDYLGLASHPALTRAARDAAEQYGIGAGSARLVGGTTDLHAALEADIATLKRTDAAVVLSTGYHVNAGVIPALVGEGDQIFSDALNHASLIDGCRLSAAQVSRYRHVDADHLDSMLAAAPPARQRLIVTETVFGMDGDLAPLVALVEIARRHDAWLMVDEAHATGVFGPRGGGLADHLGVSDEIDVQMGTLSKAVGALGGFVAGSDALAAHVVNEARTFVYTTALPASIAAAARAAIDLVTREPERRERLWRHADFLRDQLTNAGFVLGASRSPILPVLVGEAETAVRFSDDLLARGVFVPAIRPPTVPEGTARLRVTPMATHTEDDLREAVDAFIAAGRWVGLV
jgi:8-amino-7-oxononanoate synthase